LLHGVTGSGKTLVYLEAIAEALALGRGVIVMVPEISLTPQLTGRMRRRFGEDVLVSHSGLSQIERRDVWRMIEKGKARIVVGPRSVVFAPVRDLGLIVIDEEHDDSYKQSEPAPRYHGRDAALYRAYRCGATVLMGSATPDVCSYKNAGEGRYHLLELRERYGDGALPDVWVVKWGIDAKGRGISPRLEKSLRQCLARDEQAIILVNRRAFSTVIRCPDCGEVATCPNCDITLRYHRVGQKLVCHYCGYVQRVIDTCPKCHGHRLSYGGMGTQRLQRELELLLPDARVGRMDVDTTHGRGAHQEILARFARHDFDILIGTQMVAKGHDFPRVTLVGVLSADLEWLRPDFRAMEKAYRLLTQASGRTGRAGAGEVVIQAWDPTHPMLRWVQEHNYRKLFNEEIHFRNELRYPPYSDLISILVRGSERENVGKAALSLREALIGENLNCEILGPAPPPIERIENLYRKKLLLKLPRRKRVAARNVKARLQDAIRKVERNYKDIKIIADVDPAEI
ncbi:MAG TPA: primosomal protein N', partial [Bacteroidetes bacterium]|nr:primosomal protein N' [Bacteroidota bacterium]